MTEDLQKKRSRNLVALAYEEIKEMLNDGRIAQGELLSENQIADELGISRTPVREAFRALASENIVEIRKGIGIYVKTFTPKEILDTFEVRAALEILAVTSAIEEIGDDEIAVFYGRFSDMLTRYRENDEDITEEFNLMDRQLHDMFLEKSRNRCIRRMMKSINFNIRRCQMLSLKASPDMAVSIEQHLRILELLKERDLNNLVLELKNHMIWAANLLLQNYNGMDFSSSDSVIHSFVGHK
jgi:DNA-binding GntR family transcriptional regulator